MRIVAAIPARLESTRLPKKLLREICGKSLIARTYEATVNSNLFDDVLVITNSREIIFELENSKIKYIFDDANYQTGTDRIAGVASKIEADIIISASVLCSIFAKLTTTKFCQPRFLLIVIT